MTSDAPIRAADALLRSLGGSEISLRVPTGIAATASSELGLAPPLFEDVALAPVVVRTRTGAQAGSAFDLLVSASAVAALVEARNLDSAGALFGSALGFIYNGDLLRIESVASDDFASVPYMYRIAATLRSTITANP